MTFQEALDAFSKKLTEKMEEYNKTMVEWNKQHPDKPYYSMSLEPGSKNIRVVCITGGGVSASAYCFIEKETGTILKTAGWKMPAKGARGNIFNPETYARMDHTTGWLYLR